MSTSYGGTPPGITGTHYGGASLGCRGDAVPAAGLDGPGYLFAGLSLPADAAVEVRGPITRWPAGPLVVYEDSALDYLGATDYALYQLYADGVASTTDIGYGPGIGRIDLLVGAGALSGAVQLADAVAAGQFGGGAASGLSGGVQLADVVPAGQLTGSVDSTLGGAVTLDDVAAGGVLGGALPISAPPLDRRAASALRAPRIAGNKRR